MSNLFNVLVDLAELLPGTVKGTATGGSTTTLVDSNRAEPDDHWNGGTIFFGSGNNAGGSATIVDFTNSTGTFTFAAQAGACAAGNTYTASMFDSYDLVRAVNQALQECGQYIDIDSSLTGDDSTTEFTMPAGVTDVRRVRVGESTVSFDWMVADGMLIFGTAPESETLYIFHVAQPGTMALDADIIPPTTGMTRLKWTAAFYALYNRMMYSGNDTGYIKDVVTMAQKKMSEMATRYPVLLMPPDPHHNQMWK